MAKQNNDRRDYGLTDHNKDTLQLTTDDPNKSMGQVLAGEILKGHTNSALMLNNLLRDVYGETAGLNDWMQGLIQTTKAVKDGNLSDLEGMLVGQAYALDALFLNLIRKAQDTNFMPQLETFTRLALKAQNQSRATAQTLATIKNPQQTVFMKQANIANGPQQVNNNCQPLPGSTKQKNPPNSPKNFKTEQNELYKAHEEIKKMDTGTTGKTGRGDQEMEAMGAIDGAKNSKRKGKSGSKRL